MWAFFVGVNRDCWRSWKGESGSRSKLVSTVSALPSAVDLLSVERSASVLGSMLCVVLIADVLELDDDIVNGVEKWKRPSESVQSTRDCSRACVSTSSTSLDGGGVLGSSMWSSLRTV